MVLADGAGLPLAVCTASAWPNEVTLVEATLDACLLDELPCRIIGDKAYDSDALDERLWREGGVELIAPNRQTHRQSQDLRKLRRYRRRWKVKRLISWLTQFRRIVTRYERLAENFLGFPHLACARILLRRF
jgi:transposase